MSLQNIKDRMDNGEILPKLVALGRVIRYVDSRSCLKSGKIREEFKPLVQEDRYEQKRSVRERSGGSCATPREAG